MTASRCLPCNLAVKDVEQVVQVASFAASRLYMSSLMLHTVILRPIFNTTDFRTLAPLPNALRISLGRYP